MEHEFPDHVHVSPPLWSQWKLTWVQESQEEAEAKEHFHVDRM